MVLLKAKEFAETSGRKQAFNLTDIAAEARAIIESAQRERHRILAQSQHDADAVRQQAQEEGYRAGREKGLVEGKQQGYDQALEQAKEEFTRLTNETLNALRTAYQQFDQAKQELLWRTEQGTVILALAIAEKVIKQTAAVRREVAVENLKAALGIIAQTTDVAVKLNPADVAHIEKLAGTTDAVLGKYAGIRFESDETVETGGCILCTPNGEIDGQLDTQIKRIADELLTNSTGH
jgi:flagellar assembly protein FliH